MILLTGILLTCFIISIINLDFSSDYILQRVKPILEGGLIFYFLLRLLV